MTTIRTDYINARVEPKLKRDAHKALKNVGLSTSDAITLFLRQVVIHRGLPFSVNVPNAATREAIRDMRDALSRDKKERFDTTDEMFASILGKNWKKKYA